MADDASQHSSDVIEFQDRPAVGPLVAYYVILAVLLAGSFVPDLRLWGFNVWGHQGLRLPLICFLVGLVLPLPALLLHKRWRDDWSGPASTTTMVFLGAGATVMVALFYFWRARSFYLGDGYTVLSLLSEEVPLVKKRDLGEALIHVWVKHLHGGEGEAAALFSFQAISIVAGVVALGLLFWAGFKLFEKGWQRLAFPLLTISGGFSLLYFGYVENYSVFVTVVLAFGLVGLLVSRGKISRWWATLPMALALFMHVFGAALIPAFIYLLVSDTRLGDRLARVGKKTRLLLLLVAFGGLGTLFFYFYFNIYYFRFSLVPLIPDRFTVEGYWLLAPAHLLDTVNLVQLLLPSTALILVVAIRNGLKNLWRRREYRFLLVFCIGALAEVFVFDPKLGMARDWDLFSLLGVPLALGAAWLVLDSRNVGAPRPVLITMVAGLGFLVLIPRVLSQTDRDVGFAWFESYTRLDMTKSMYARSLIYEYHMDRGDSAMVEETSLAYPEDYPCWVANREGIRFKQAGDCAQAIPRFEEAIRLHPLYAAAYTNLGVCLRNMGSLDSSLAMLKIAVALNPYNATIAKELGAVYFMQGQFKKAEECLLEALEIDSENRDALVGLVQLYGHLGKNDLYLEYLHLLVQNPEAPMAAYKELAEHYVKQRDWSRAGELYRRAIELGLDTTYVRILREQAPQLGL